MTKRDVPKAGPASEEDGKPGRSSHDGRRCSRRVAPNQAIQSTAETFGRGDWTVRDLVERLGFGDGPIAVGSPAAVADAIQEWLEETDADGLNLGHVVTPGVLCRLR